MEIHLNRDSSLHYGKPFMTSQTSPMQIQQMNSFYNYTYGLDVTEVDLIKTAGNLLHSNIVKAVCFSDLKVIYLDSHDSLKIECLQPKGRQWDNGWVVNFSDSLPKHIINDLTTCLGLSFNEQRIEGAGEKQAHSYLRAALPPIVLESDDLNVSIRPWLKLYSDGIMSISFQLSMDFDNISEEDFINDIVNLFKRYFDRIWVKAELQRMDGEQILSDSFSDEFSIAGQNIVNKKSKKFFKEMKITAQKILDDSLKKEGKCFYFHGDSWTLHQIAASDEQSEEGVTLDTCRSIYANAVLSQIAEINTKRRKKKATIQLWEGRP